MSLYKILLALKIYILIYHHMTDQPCYTVKYDRHNRKKQPNVGPFGYD
jgi:hypothetical protein